MNKRLFQRPLMLIPTALLIIACMAGDRAAKNAAVAFRGRPPVVLAGGLVTVSYAENRGAVLSIGAGLPERTRFLIFTMGVAALLLAVAGGLLFAPGLSRISVTALSLILAGGGSNLLDRLSHDGKVVDFLILGTGTLRTGIFNLADLSIVIGAFLLLLTIKKTWSPKT